MLTTPSPIQAQQSALPKPALAPAARLLKAAHFDLVCALAEHGSLRAAAVRMRLSQSALSRQLQQLEQKVGMAVVDRVASGVRLTPTGERLLVLAQSMRQMEEQWMHELHAGRRQLRGHVRICAFSSVLRSVVVPTLAPLLRRYPCLTVALKSEELYLIPNRGVSGEADLFLTQMPVRLEGYASWTIGYELNLLIEGTRQQPSEAVFLDHEPEDRFTEHYLSVTGQQPSGPLRRLFLDDIYGLVDGVRLGLGRAVVPLHLIRHDPEVRPVNSAPALRVPVVLNVRQTLLDIGAVRAVVETLQTKASAYLPEPPHGMQLFDAPFAGPLHRLAG